ncbi:phosphatase PAP2 family protein [Bacillus weihaiensis]|uniref:Phosphatidic acid phosphatase type 2/haloperoxidase domain-containing protein n=1 Tax=Bacillus weihaiensis TaxID=1547283 RepID=A0A1L3MQW7_9BACI|nr:phosphatase PAP2 family protein [Bacillus weihaiensis]APH04726.1 hypothetical protein A9C19_08175 [Bacillus weihaiensis]
MIAIILILVIVFIGCAVMYPIPFFYEWDVKTTLFFEDHRTPFLTEFFLFITDLGSIKYILPICIIFTIFFLYKRMVIEATLLMIMFFSVRYLNILLKNIFVRNRPNFDAVYEAVHYSFPSGHAMNSIATYGFLFILLTLSINVSRAWRGLSIVIVCIFIGLIGMSRIYLGVHYVTDIVAGFCAGGIWLLIFQAVSRKIPSFRQK